MRELGYTRLTWEPNVYKHPEGKAHIMLYVDDLLFVGETQAINNIFNKKQEKMLLRATGEASPGNTISSLGRKITNKGDHWWWIRGQHLPRNEAQQMQPSNSHRNNSRKSKHRRWTTSWPTRASAISTTCRKFAMAGIHQTRHQLCNKKLARRYLAGTKDYKFSIRPTIKLYDNTPQQLDLNIFVDSHWAGRHQTRRSATGFVTELLGTCIHFGSRTQARSTVISRSWILCDRHWSTRSTLHQELHHGSPEHKAHQRAHPHRQLSRQVHGNKTRSIKTSKTHRTQIHVPPEPHPRRRGITTQDTNQRQPGKHPHKACDSRSAEMAHLQHRHQHSLKPSYSRYHQYHQYVCNTHRLQHTFIGQIWLSHGRTQTSAAILNAIMHLVFFKKYQRTTS